MGGETQETTGSCSLHMHRSMPLCVVGDMVEPCLPRAVPRQRHNMRGPQYVPDLPFVGGDPPPRSSCELCSENCADLRLFLPSPFHRPSTAVRPGLWSDALPTYPYMFYSAPCTGCAPAFNLVRMCLILSWPLPLRGSQLTDTPANGGL